MRPLLQRHLSARTSPIGKVRLLSCIRPSEALKATGLAS